MIGRFIAALAAVALITAPIAHADATEHLSRIPVKAADSSAGYSREQFGEPWTDDNGDEFGHNHCDTRDDILARDLSSVMRHGCKVLSGVLPDPYTNQPIEFKRGPGTSGAVQIDHVVPLGDAWRTGAQNLSPQERINLANDPRNLLAVDGPTNDHKGDKDASEWLPPNKDFYCSYVTKQVLVKSIYHLWITPAEHDAMARVLSNCK